MPSHEFIQLQTEFQSLSVRFKEAQNLTEKQAILKEARRVIDDIESLIQIHGMELEERIHRARERILNSEKLNLLMR